MGEYFANTTKRPQPLTSAAGSIGASRCRTMNGRGRLAGMVLAGVILAGAVGWFAGTQIRSPAEVASRTNAPVAAPILVPAEERVLSTDIVTRGTARFGSPQQLSLAVVRPQDPRRRGRPPAGRRQGAQRG